MNLPKFWMAVWAQPIESFSKWKAEGVNLVIKPDPSNNNTAAQRRKACADNGLFYMDMPESVADVETLVADPYCYALMLPDEPEINANLPWYTDPNFAKALSDWMAIWKPRFDAVKNRKTIWANFAGYHAMNARPWYNGELVRPFVEQCHATEISMDIYPINTNVQTDWTNWNANPPNPNNDPFIVKGDVQQVYCLKLLKNWFPTLPQWAYLEVDQFEMNPNGRGPTPDEMQMQVDQLLKQGVKGLIYFSHSLGMGLPWDAAGAHGKTSWDGRSDAQAAKCKEIASKLTQGSVAIPPTDLAALSNRVSALEAAVVTLKSQMISDIQFTLKKGI